jgi:hypothetical protein
MRMKNSQFFMIATLSLMISVGAFSQNNGRERIKSPTSSMEVKQAMQERQNKAKEQKATQLREREAQRKEAEAKRSEMQEKMQLKRWQMYQPEGNAMPKAAVRKKTTNNLRQKDITKLALDSIVQLESWKETYRYDYYGRIIESIGYRWNVSEWELNNKYEYAYLGDVTTEIKYNWDGSDWEPNKKREYATDANGNQILEAYYDWSDTVWIGDYKSVFAYDSEGRLILREDYSDWNDTTNTWIGDRKMVSAYDSEGRLILEEDYNAWNDTAGTWIGNNKRVSAYDSEGRLILEESYNAWNDTAGTWIGNTKKIYTYDGDDKPSIEERYGWSDSTDTWIETDKFTYTYAHGMELDKHHYVWNTDSNDWQEMEKTIGTIHTDGGISLRMVYQWNGSDWDTASKRETMAYDTLGNMLETEVIFFTYTSPIWDELQKIIYTWDSNGKWTEIIIYNYNSGTWEENFKVEQNHDIYGNLSMEAYYYWSSGAWVGNYKYEYAYDANGKQTMEAYYYWSSGKWKGNYKYERVYDVNGNQIMYASYNWNDSVWVGNYKYEGAYDANGYETLDAYYTWGDSVWVGYYKYEYGYDANGVQTMIAYYDDWSNGKWIGNYRNEWANDANGNLLFSQYQDGWDSTWKYGYKYVNAYDINENQILSEYSVWDTISKTWVKVNRQERAFKDTYIYFTTDFPLYNRYYEWDSTAWELQKSTEWIYNTVGDIIEVVYSELFNDSLKVKTRMLTTTDTTHLRASLVFDEQWEIMFSQHLRTDYYKYDSVQTIIKHDSMLYYWSSINVWSPPTYTISGKVTVDGNPLKGVQITYATSKSVTTNSSGEYTVSVDSGSTVALVPSKAGYVFTPTSITCSNVSSNLYNKDFQATDVGIADVDNTNTELVVYPNPTKGIVYISSECDIKLYDIQGKKLQEIRGNQIDISSYPQGMYFLKVDGKTLKVVKE